MPSVQAYQHIYSNVEKEQSPQGRGGFQTLFHTHAGLSEAEVAEMEGRLLYFSSQVEPVKHLFFSLSSGKGVVAQIVVLPEPDQMGRRGRYLAHSLAFDPDALAQFEADPFRVFRRCHFITSISAALAQGNFQTGDLPAISLTLPSEPERELEAAKAWPVPELKKLALLALQAKRQADNREAITIAGEPAQIESTLAAAFLVVPTAVRPHCSFDTYFYRCNLVAAYFWAIGLVEPPVGIKFVLIDPHQRQLQGNVPVQPDSPYEHWVLSVIEAGQLAEIISQRDDAWAISAWLGSQAVDSTRLDAVSPELVVAMFKADPPAVQNRVQRQVGGQLPSALVERVAGQIYQHTNATSLYRQLRQGFALPQLVAGLYESYAAEQFKTPPRSELKALADLPETAQHALLSLCLAYWRDPNKALAAALDQADETAYRQFSEIVLRLNLLKPLSLLRPGRGDVFLDLYLSSGDIDWVELSEGLIKAKEAACLARLAGQVGRLPGKELQQLLKLSKDQPDLPASFRTAVEQAVAARPAQGGLKNMLQSVWRRLPGQK